MPANAVAPEKVQEKAAEILGRSYYKLEENTWASEFLAMLRDLFRRLARPLDAFFDHLYETSPFLYYILLALLTLLAVGLLVHIALVVMRVARRRRFTPTYTPAEDPRRHTPEYWEGEADTAVAGGDYLTAIRYLLHATLLRLEQRHKGTLRRAATHREYLRRFRATPVHDSLREMVDTVEARWFGQVPCTAEDYQRCRSAHASLLHTLGSSVV